MTIGLSRTGVPWVANPDGSTPGFAWNVIAGCLKRCEWCYAWELAKGRLRERYLGNKNNFAGQPSDPFAPRVWHDRWPAPFRRRKPSGIFVVNMGDLFGPWVPTEYIHDVIQAIWECPQHRFYVLTKFPQRLPEFNPWPENAWVGATATSFSEMVEALRQLEKVKAKIKYLSLEPLLSFDPAEGNGQELELPDWIIVGPLNGKLVPQHPCKAEWLLGIRQAAQSAGVAIFEKPECARILDRPLRLEWPDA